MDLKPLKYTSLEGLSEKQLKEHHDVLYAGYVKKTNEIRQALKTADTAGANATYSQLGELKREETFALNGVKLHEGYFDNMTGAGGGEPQGVLRQWIEEDFGSLAFLRSRSPPLAKIWGRILSNSRATLISFGFFLWRERMTRSTQASASMISFRSTPRINSRPFFWRSQ